MAAGSLLSAVGCMGLARRLGGASTGQPQDLPKGLSVAARALWQQVYADVDSAKLADYHVHLLGTGEKASGCYVNPRMLTWAHPWHHFRFEVYRSASFIKDPSQAETQFINRLRSLAQTVPGKLLLLAFAQHHGPDGQVVGAKTEFHVPNAHALQVARSDPSHFAAAGSVHPRQPGACEELRRLHAQGVRVIKWLPNAMGIDPADSSCDAFYATLHQQGMALLSHGGEEAAVDAVEAQCLGNPQRLQRALEHGVKVIVAHCASLGKGIDQSAPNGPPVQNWRLLLRMMDDPRWQGLLFTDISATTQMNRTPEFLRTLLSRGDLHQRMVNGSDYPLPAVNCVISLRHWIRAGLLEPTDADPLRELYNLNPLVFDYALKRRLRLRHPGGRECRLAASIFQEHPALPLQGS